MDFEIPSDAQNYLDYTNSVLTVKNTIPNGGKKIKLVFHQEIDSSSKTTSGLLEDDYVWVTMRDINDDYSKTLYGTLETESIISSISDYTVSVIDMTSPIIILNHDKFKLEDSSFVNCDIKKGDILFKYK